MRALARTTFLSVLLFCGQLAYGTIRNSNGSASDVQNLVNLSASGDTVTIPAGSFTWTTTVRITGKALTLQGAGSTASHITDQGSGGAAIDVDCSAANLVRVTGLEFIKSTTHVDGIVQFFGSGAGLDQVGFRIDHCKFSFPSTGGRAIYPTGIFGLIDHNTFVVSAAGSQQSISVSGSSSGSDGGFTPWTRPLTLGTNHAVYIEDNTFDYTGNDQSEDAIDCYAGARVVVRHNTFLSCTQGFHVLDSGDMRSLHSFEIYANTYTNNSSTTLRQLTLRGGTGVVYGNTYGGSHGSWSGITLMYYRATGAPLAISSWQQCDGTGWQLGSSNLSSQGSRTCSTGGGVCFNNADHETLGACGGNFTTKFDGTGLHGYPGRDQPGRSTGQVLEPVYVWNNGTNAPGTWAGGDPADEDLVASFIQINRDYYFSTNSSAARPAYTAYTYPHPLQGTGSPPPAPPQNLQVVTPTPTP